MLKSFIFNPPPSFLHFHIANFFKFIAVNLSLNHFLTCVKPLYNVYLIPYFSFASANTRSIVSFLLLYSSLYLGTYLASSAFSTHLFHMCLNTVFSYCAFASGCALPSFCFIASIFPVPFTIRCPVFQYFVFRADYAVVVLVVYIFF